jgi:hypothetical protein
VRKKAETGAEGPLEGAQRRLRVSCVVVLLVVCRNERGIEFLDHVEYFSQHLNATNLLGARGAHRNGRHWLPCAMGKEGISEEGMTNVEISQCNAT